MMSSLFVKVDCGWEEAEKERRISLTVLRPVRSPLSQSTSKHLPCTAERMSPTHVPLHPSSPLASSRPFVSYLACTVPAQENLSLTS